MTKTLEARDLSSVERARVTKLVASIGKLLEAELVQKGLPLINKGTVSFEIRNGIAEEITISTAMRRGKELPT